MKKVLMVGVGSMGSHHLECWRQMDDVQVVGICDIEPGRAASKAKEGEAVFTDMDEALNALPDLDFVDIATPSYTHKELALKSIRRGIHTVSEKPVALYKEDAIELFNAAREHNVCFMVAQVVRFMRPYIALREILSKGTYGGVMRAEFRRLSGTPYWSWQNWMMDEEKSGGVPFDLSIHDVDYIVSVFGEPERVEKHRAICNDEGLTDAYTVMMHYGDTLVTAEAGWYNAKMPFKADFRVICEKAVILFDGAEMTVYPRGVNTEPIPVDLSAAKQTKVEGLNITSGDGYFEELCYFKSCALNGENTDYVPESEILAVLGLAR